MNKVIPSVPTNLLHERGRLLNSICDYFFNTSHFEIMFGDLSADCFV